MTLKSAYVVPSRGRPENIKRLAKAFKDTEARSDLWVIIDEDDWHRKDYERGAEQYDYGYLVVENYTKGCAKSLNAGVEILLNDEQYDYYGYFGFMGDDHIPRTLYWDYILELAIPYGKNGIAYGNDLFQGGNLPTSFLTTRAVADHLGGLTPPKTKHLYFDNFVKKLGQDLSALYYKHDVIIEHLHPVARKAAMDDNYARVNSPEMYEYDRTVYEEYINSQEYKDLVAILC